MNWIDRVLMRLLNFFVIENAEGDPYLCRYRILRLPFLRVYIHHILRSDEDPDMHDHPWNFVSVVLWRGYLEFLPGLRARRIRAGSIVRHRAADCHRLELDAPAWTLIFATGGPKKRVWGFHTKDGWVAYDTYFDRKYGVGNWRTG